MTDSTTRARPGRPKNPERTQQRKEEILAAAAVVFARHGYDATDLEEVAKAVGVSKAAIYYYFQNKESLFLAAVDQGMRLLSEAVQGLGAGVEDPIARVGEAIRAYLRFFHDHPQFVELLIQERAAFRDRKKSTYFEHRDASAQRWRDLFTGLIRAGRVRDLPVDRLLDVISDQVYGAMFTAHFTGSRKSPDKQAADIIDIVLGGCSPRPSGGKPVEVNHLAIAPTAPSAPAHTPPRRLARRGRKWAIRLIVLAGVIEGACRHLVMSRMCRTGMCWTLDRGISGHAQRPGRPPSRPRRPVPPPPRDQ